MSAPRPLPARPSLEFERKEAKALLRRLRAGDPDAQLSDAQFVRAREYGFASWPKLVRYFGDVERQRLGRSHASLHTPDFYEGSVRGLLAQHRQRRQLGARTLASYVPRLYALPVEDVFAATITEDEARLAVARQNGFPSWAALLERAATQPPRRESGWEVEPFERAARAIGAGDLDALRHAIDAHPELLRPSAEDLANGRTLLRSALLHEMRGAPVRPIVDWLVAQGLDLQRELNMHLHDVAHTTPEQVRWLLDRGADPNWVAPNGVPVLEQALIRYWNGAAVDVLAERATPRRALWIAAGLGDVDGVRRLLDRDGRPAAAARRIAPPFDAGRGLPTHPDPGGEEILLEAFFVAMLNGRTTVMEYMASRGFDVNTLLWDSPVLNVAVGNAWVPVVACLLRCGANPDIVGYHPTQSARGLAVYRLVNNDRDAGVHEVAELLGMDPDAVLAEHDARAAAPVVDPQLQAALALAGDDAFRRGQPDIRPENLLFGLLRGGGLAQLYFTKASGMDRERFHADVAERVRPGAAHTERPALPMSPDAQEAIRLAIAVATGRRRDTVQGIHLLHALTRDEHGAASELLARYGSSAAALNAELDRGM